LSKFDHIKYIDVKIYMKEILWKWLETKGNESLVSRIVDYFIIGLIIFNVIAFTLETNTALHNQHYMIFKYFELFSVIVFSGEYLLRVISCTASKSYSKPISGRIKYILQPLSLIDLIAILPFYLPFLGIDLRSLRILRLFRLLRILKLTRYIIAAEEIKEVFSSKKQELFVSIVLTSVMLYLSAMIMFFAENEAQPDKFPDIITSLWWATATLTTVGYGDVFPVTPLGKCITAVIALLGIGIVALPAGLISAGFINKVEKKHNCPHCGKEINK